LVSDRNAPLVSVLIPCFNAERWIAETVASVRAQAYRPIEIVCVDDGSHDGTAAALQRLAGPDLRILSQEHRGGSAAQNAALAVAQGDLIQFLDADDLLDPRKIESQAARLRVQPSALAAAAWARFHTSPSEARFEPELCWVDAEPVVWLSRAWHSGGGMMFPGRWLAPRQLVERAGPWNEALTVHNDGEYFTRLVLQATQVLHVEAARAYYRSGIPGTLSGRIDSISWNSYHRSLELMTASLASELAHDELRRGLGLLWQRFAYACFPYEPALAEDAWQRGTHLHPARLRPEGGWRFHWLTRVAGWRMARRVQFWSGRT
jgi:glycosyltransferase involved in cell wall biosynthesis